jgi:hypothetical protein
MATIAANATTLGTLKDTTVDRLIGIANGTVTLAAGATKEGALIETNEELSFLTACVNALNKANKYAEQA